MTELARIALTIEEHYGRPMDIEWGKDGVDGKLYVLQARPETVVSRRGPGVVERHRRSGIAGAWSRAARSVSGSGRAPCG